MRRLAALLACLATPAVAQDWATRERCFSDPLPVTAEHVRPHDLAALEAEAARIPNARGRFWRIEHPSGAVSHLWGTMHITLPQALNLLNDPSYVESAHALAAWLESLPIDEESKAVVAFRTAVSRKPSEAETAALLDLYYKRNSWFSVAQVILNLDETITRP